MDESSAVVFSTVELLEIILLNIDVRTLLLSAPQVCRQWNSVINVSLPLQQALFFQPKDVSCTNLNDDRIIQPKVQNPFLKDLFPAWFRNTNTSHVDEHLPNSDMFRTRELVKASKLFQETKLYKKSITFSDNPFLRESASWQGMLISQPPCRKIVAASSRLIGNWYYPDTADPKDGLRMVDLYGITLQHAAKHSLSGFMVIWPEGGEDGWVPMMNHLVRASAGMDRGLEVSGRLIWNCQPDLVIRLIRTHSRPSGPLDFDDPGLFWTRCGVKELLPGLNDKVSDYYASEDIEFRSAGVIEK